MSDAPIRLALIGAGRWGRNYIRTIATLRDARLTAVASTNPETRALVAPDCRVITHWRDLLAFEEFDGVIIATPPAQHAPMLAAAAAEGKAVLVEKPLVQSTADLAAVETAAATATRAIMVEHTHLFHPGFRTLVEEAKRRGAIRGVRTSAGSRGPYRSDISVLWDWGAHDASMCLDLLGPDWAAVDAQILEARLIDGARAERVRLSLLFSGRVPVEIQISTLDDKHRWFAVDFDRQTLIFQDEEHQPLKLCPRSCAESNEAGTVLAVPMAVPPLTRAVIEFVDAIRIGSMARDSLRMGITVVQILDECEKILRRRS